MSELCDCGHSKINHEHLPIDGSAFKPGYCGFPNCQCRVFVASIINLSYDDMCFMSQAFNHSTWLASDQSRRINEWLKQEIEARKENQ